MFRNTYLENYKCSYSNDATVEFLLCHFNHVYVTMGSILQDIQFKLSLMMSQKVNENELKREQTKSSETERFSTKQMDGRGSKALQREKEMLSQLKNGTKSTKLNQKISEIERNKAANMQKNTKKVDISVNKDSSYDDLFPVECRRSSQNSQQVKKIQQPEAEVQNLDDLNDAEFMDHLFRKRK